MIHVLIANHLTVLYHKMRRQTMPNSHFIKKRIVRQLLKDQAHLDISNSIIYNSDRNKRNVFVAQQDRAFAS